ncbi:hypothetical protein RclHR1_31300002 [Rhizophagus clarus]|uniref:Uncharacterized protein n=1 Tax=Rhizophagus clarus TaxID=94130 RepID=A0A2Z6R6Q3_9GLOM|nr:hypothetical protein RclHR1_31300002 [Rhizophagus clarus]GES94821.1 hypothetical protein RCL_jg19049.t2 [Rhizophagus clarus]
MINNSRLGFRYSNLVESAYSKNLQAFSSNHLSLNQSIINQMAIFEEITLNFKKLMSIPSWPVQVVVDYQISNVIKYESLMFMNKHIDYGQ